MRFLPNFSACFKANPKLAKVLPPPVGTVKENKVQSVSAAEKDCCKMAWRS